MDKHLTLPRYNKKRSNTLVPISVHRELKQKLKEKNDTIKELEHSNLNLQEQVDECQSDKGRCKIIFFNHTVYGVRLHCDQN